MRNKLCIFVLALIGILVLSANAAHAEGNGVRDSGECGDNLTWILYDNGELRISGTGAMWDGESWSGLDLFGQNELITSVIVGSGVTSIGNWAFYKCNQINTVTLPDTITGIGYGSFSMCSSMESINLPDSISFISNNAFTHCYELTSIDLPNSLAVIGESAFWNCYGLKTMNIPESVTSIGEGAFSGCKNLESITLPSTLTELSKGIFYGCEALKSIILPDGITTIGEDAFLGCDSLIEVTIPASVTRIERYAFSSCDSLSEVTFLGKPTHIDFSTFGGDNTNECGTCPGLRNIYFPGTEEEWGRCTGYLQPHHGLYWPTIHYNWGAPEFTVTQHPENVSAYVGATAELSVTATGVDLTYRWQVSKDAGTTWKDVSSANEGYNTDTLKLVVKDTWNNYQYRCVVTDGEGEIIESNSAKLTVKPKIISQPAAKSAYVDAAVSFSVKATGAGLTYRWHADYEAIVKLRKIFRG